MASPFSFILTVCLIGLVGAFFFERGYSKNSPLQLFLSMCMFFILSTIMFSTGIPDQVIYTNYTLNSTATQTVITYNNLTATNDGVVNGLAYFFLALTGITGIFTFISLWNFLIQRMKKKSELL